MFKRLAGVCLIALFPGLVLAQTAEELKTTLLRHMTF